MVPQFALEGLKAFWMQASSGTSDFGYCIWLRPCAFWTKRERSSHYRNNSVSVVSCMPSGLPTQFHIGLMNHQSRKKGHPSTKLPTLKRRGTILTRVTRLPVGFRSHNRRMEIAHAGASELTWFCMQYCIVSV